MIYKENFSFSQSLHDWRGQLGLGAGVTNLTAGGGGGGGGEGSTDVSSQCDRANCTSVQRVPCKNGTITFGLERCITAEHGDCEVGRHDEDCAVLLEADLSRLLQHQNVTLNFCPPAFCLKLQCTDKTNNLVFCFRGVDDTSPDSQSQLSDGASQLLSILILLVPVTVGIVLFIWHKKWIGCQKSKNVKFDEVPTGLD
ncbi:hypothetical protein AOLI_G00043180 [Acnodon oligacanthus]